MEMEAERKKELEDIAQREALREAESERKEAQREAEMEQLRSALNAKPSNPKVCCSVS